MDTIAILSSVSALVAMGAAARALRLVWEYVRKHRGNGRQVNVRITRPDGEVLAIDFDQDEWDSDRLKEALESLILKTANGSTDKSASVDTSDTTDRG